MIVITAANGRLGRAVAEELARVVALTDIRLAARSVDKLADKAGSPPSRPHRSPGWPSDMTSHGGRSRKPSPPDTMLQAAL